MRCDALQVLRSKAMLTSEHVQFMAYQLLRGLKSAAREDLPDRVHMLENCCE